MTPNFEQVIRTIEKLPRPEQDKVLQWLEEKKQSNGARENSQIRSRRSEQSLLWLNENRHGYLGRWIALDGDRLIASGQTAKEVYIAAKTEGVKIPFVELVSAEESAPFTGGWLP